MTKYDNIFSYNNGKIHATVIEPMQNMNLPTATQSNKQFQVEKRKNILIKDYLGDKPREMACACMYFFQDFFITTHEPSLTVTCVWFLESTSLLTSW